MVSFASERDTAAGAVTRSHRHRVERGVEDDDETPHPRRLHRHGPGRARRTVGRPGAAGRRRITPRRRRGRRVRRMVGSHRGAAEQVGHRTTPTHRRPARGAPGHRHDVDHRHPPHPAGRPASAPFGREPVPDHRVGPVRPGRTRGGRQVLARRAPQRPRRRRPRPRRRDPVRPRLPPSPSPAASARPDAWPSSANSPPPSPFTTPSKAFPNSSTSSAPPEPTGRRLPRRRDTAPAAPARVHRCTAPRCRTVAHGSGENQR